MQSRAGTISGSLFQRRACLGGAARTVGRLIRPERYEIAAEARLTGHVLSYENRELGDDRKLGRPRQRKGTDQNFACFERCLPNIVTLSSRPPDPSSSGSVCDERRSRRF